MTHIRTWHIRYNIFEQGHMTHIRTMPRNHQDVHADQISSSFGEKCGLQRGHKAVPLFDPLN